MEAVIRRMEQEEFEGRVSSSTYETNAVGQAQSLSREMRELRERCRRMRGQLRSDLNVLNRGRESLNRERRESLRRLRRNTPLPAAESLFPDTFLPDETPTDPRRRGRPMLNALDPVNSGGSRHDTLESLSVTVPSADAARELLTATDMTQMGDLLSPPREHPIEHMEQNVVEAEGEEATEVR